MFILPESLGNDRRLIVVTTAAREASCDFLLADL